MRYRCVALITHCPLYRRRKCSDQYCACAAPAAMPVQKGTVRQCSIAVTAPKSCIGGIFVCPCCRHRRLPTWCHVGRTQHHQPTSPVAETISQMGESSKEVGSGRDQPDGFRPIFSHGCTYHPPQSLCTFKLMIWYIV